MGKVTIQNFTYENPITMIGTEAGVCYNADTSNQEKNYKRGIECLNADHGRTFEFPQVYMILDGYSARVIREFYTHIGGAPTRLQSSTRYINYGDFYYVVPDSVSTDPRAADIYQDAINQIKVSFRELENLNIPKEDVANILPLGMETKIVVRTNLRNLMDMNLVRSCSRAYWEYRDLMKDVRKALSEYSEEWKYLIDNYFITKCDQTGYCKEKKSCGKYPSKN